MAYRDLALHDAAKRAADLINELLDRPRRRLLHKAQMRDSAQSIGANISEAFGRGEGADRARSLYIARAETEETIFHLATNFRSQRITPKEYWPRHNLLVVIVKMINGLLRNGNA
jgi:four helix bundle protein